MPVKKREDASEPEQQPDPDDSYAAYDPATVRSHISEPPPSSDDTSGASDSHPGADVSGPESEEPLPQFDPRHAEPFKGLMYLGALTKKFGWLGHSFTIRTLMTDEELAIGLLVKEWDGTIAQNRAYATAVVAACVQTVDGQELPGPAFEEPDDVRLRRRFNVVSTTWYPATIDAVFEQYVLLSATVGEVLTAMGEASGQMAA